MSALTFISERPATTVPVEKEGSGFADGGMKPMGNLLVDLFSDD